MAKSSLTIGDLLYRLGFENDDQFVASLEAVLKRGEKTVEKSGGDAGKKGGRAAGRGFTDQFKATFSGAAIGSFVGTALSAAFQGALQAAARFAGESVREFAVYEQGLLQLKLAGETNLAALSKRIQDTAKATKVFSATDVSLAVGDLVKAGYDAETAFALVEIGALGASTEVDAMTGKFGDLTTTAGQLGNILRALGYDTSQAGRVMDVMAKAAQDSNLNVSDLVDIVARVGPTAKLAGLEVEDLAAAAANLSNSGMDASLIGTGLRSVLQALINPSGEMKGKLDALGVSLVDSNGNLRDWGEVLDGLNELTQRGGEGLQILTQATGSFGSTAASVMGTASDAIQAYTRDLQGAEGATQNLANEVQNSAAGAFAAMESAIANARVELGQQLMPIVLTLYESVLPGLVGVLGEVLDLLDRSARDYAGFWDMSAEDKVVTVLGEPLAGALGYRRSVEDVAYSLENLRSQAEATKAEIAELEEQANLPAWRDIFGINRRRAAEQLIEKQKELARLQAEINRVERMDAEAPGRRPGASPGVAGVTPGEINIVAEAYRNLEAIEKELAEARKQWAAAGTAEEEARWAAEVKRLEAEKKAKQAAVETAQAAAKAVTATTTKDPLIDEAQRVQNDLQRLKLAYEQGKLSAKQYEDAVAAHLRRLDGLYERAASPEQSLAVLRARKVFLDELGRLSKAQADADAKATAESEAALQRIVDAWQEYADSRKAAQASIDDAAAERASKREEHAMLKVVNAWKAYAQSLKDAQALQDAEAARDAAREARREETALRRVVEAHNEYTASLKEAARLQEENAARIAARQTAKEAGQLQLVVEAHQQYVESLKEAARIEAERAAAQARAAQAASTRQALANLYPGHAGNAAGPTLAERASGSFVKLAQAQRTLGVATRDDVQAALEGQISAIERLLPIVEEGSDRYYELVAALAAARGALATLNAEVPDAKIPGMGSIDQIKTALRETEATIARIQADIAAGPDTATLAMLESRLAFFRALLNELRQALNLQEQAAKDKSAGDSVEAEAEAIAGRLMDIATSFPKAIVSGIQSGDISGALRNALGNASDFFLDEMLKAIIGPITKELTASIASSLAAQSATGGAGGVMGALGPTGWVLGGLALVASMLIGSQQRKQIAERPATAAKAAVSGAPSVTYNLTGNVTVNSNASWSDPAFQARWRSETESLLVSLLGKVRR